MNDALLSCFTRGLFVLFWACGVATCLAANPADVPVRYEYYRTSYSLNDDASSQESHEWAFKVLKQQAVDWAKHTSISYSTSVQQAEIVEAYTRKADGRRIDVRKDNYQYRTNEGKDKNSPVFTDYASISVVFPDVAVGDTIVFSYRIKQTEAIFPGHFSVVDTFAKQSAFDDVQVSIEYPEKLWVQYRSNGLKETVDAPSAGRKRVQWSYANPQPLMDERQDYSVFDPDKEVGYSFSTFKNYAEIAAAYGVRALPKAAVTDRIRGLAKEIVAGKTAPREQARALYEWVATKITYGGNCVGVGTVVPHDLEFVIDNKMGDCKDHATLLQALLAAQGIEAQQVLINSGSEYALPAVPVVANINHVINYIPSLDLYVDSTSASTPFGMLPRGDRGKPVLHVAHYKEGTKTPVPAKAAEQKVISKLQIDAEGNLSGSVEVVLKGDVAVGAREWARKLTRNQEDDMVKNMFRSWGMAASGTLEKDDPTDLTDSYRFKVNITKVEKYLKFANSGAFYIFPLFSGGISIYQVVPSGLEPDVKVDTTCTSGVSEEEYTIVLPPKMKVLSVPSKLDVSNRYQHYKASYVLKKNVLTVKRSLDDRTPKAVCSAEESSDFIKLGAKVTENLKAQVLYK